MKNQNFNIFKVMFLIFVFSLCLVGCSKNEKTPNEIKPQKTELEILEENLPFLESEESKLIREHNQKMLGFDSSKEDEYRKQLQERKKKVWAEMGWKEDEFQNEQERKYVEEFTDPNNRKFQLYLMYNIYNIEHEGNTDLIRAYAEIIYNHKSNYIMRKNAIKRLVYIRNESIKNIISDCLSDYDPDVCIISFNALLYVKKTSNPHIFIFLNRIMDKNIFIVNSDFHLARFTYNKEYLKKMKKTLYGKSENYFIKSLILKNISYLLSEEEVKSQIVKIKKELERIENMSLIKKLTLNELKKIEDKYANKN